MCILSFHGTWMDMLVAGTLAAILQLVNFCLSKLDSMEFLIEPVGAFIVSFAAVAFKLTFQDMICYQTIALSGVLDQLPGLTLCTSMVELTSGHIISGTARLMSGLVRALLLAFGLSIGYKTWLLFLPQSNNFFTCYPELAVANSSYWIPIFISLLPCMAVSLTLSLRPHKSQFPIMLLTSCLAFWVSLLNSTCMYFFIRSSNRCCCKLFVIPLVCFPVRLLLLLLK
ncbi:hypothetical protein HMI54_002434 [Coelomomyces lativittatus]|nr:hypothetical protein HMI54_002434 [Coelomomyces lativittatus]